MVMIIKFIIIKQLKYTELGRGFMLAGVQRSVLRLILRAVAEYIRGRKLGGRAWKAHCATGIEKQFCLLRCPGRLKQGLTSL